MLKDSVGKDSVDRLLYFDAILRKLDEGDPDFLVASGRHVHWGSWPHPERADGSVADFAAAAEELTIQVSDAGNVRDGIAILDAGCGFGGTVASLNDRLKDADIVGLNIDERQIERARSIVTAKNSNQVRFVVGDACELPFPDASFDVVLAVECIFHFPSRLRFMEEARRVLRPGGKLALCDFLPAARIPGVFVNPLRKLCAWAARTYGPTNFETTLDDYEVMGGQAGLTQMQIEDITSRTLPTYPVLCKLIAKAYPEPGHALTATRLLQWFSRVGILRYMILSFSVA